MKNLKNKLLSVFFIVVIISICILSVFISSNKEKKTIYNIKVEINENSLNGEMDLLYVNNNKSAISELFFCLYPNAFKSESNIKNTTVLDRLSEAYPNGFDSGYINIKDVFVDNNKTEFFLEENDQILKINIPKTVPNKSIMIKIKFDEKLPKIPGRFGYGENTFNFGNWYPVLCPFVDGVPYKSIYCANGDPFFSECADYNIQITAPSEFIVASSGQILKKEMISPISTKWTICEKNIRDFAFIVSDKFNIQSKKVKNTLVYSYYLNNDEIGKFAVDIAKNALEVFNELFGDYPYQTLSIAESDFYIGGMEYPNLVYINSKLYNTDSLEALEEVIVHEVAHQWWYGVIGNNEIEDAWIDEGLTQYSVALYYEKIYGKERYKSFLTESEIYCKVVFDILNDANINYTKNIERNINDFEHWILYDAITYDVSALMFDELREKIGDKYFFIGLKDFYEKNKFKIVDKKNLINSLNYISEKNISGIIEPWLKGKVYWG